MKHLIFVSFLTLSLSGLAQSKAKQIKAMSKDAAFLRVMKTAFSESVKTGKAVQKLTATKRTRLASEMRSYAGELKKMKKVPKRFPPSLAPYVPLGLEKLGQLTRDLNGIREKYELRTLSEYGAAASLFFFKMEYTFHPIDPDYCSGADCDCYGECNEEFREKYNSLILGFATLGVSNLKLASVGSLTWLTGWFETMADVIELQNDLADCLAACDDEPSDWECQEHEDCGPDEFCKKPFGNPVNHCSPKRPEGWACSGHVKCASGCCKYHPFTNPFEKTCRPADKCS